MYDERLMALKKISAQSSSISEFMAAGFRILVVASWVLLIAVQAGAQLSIQLTNDNHSVVLSWKGGGYQLQQATNLLGPYSAVTGATNPYVQSIGPTASFFQLQQQLAGGGVNGSVFMQTESNAAPGQLFLPDIEVYLHNTGTSVDGQPVVSDYFGRFRFPKQLPGTYQLRWNAQLGWAAGQDTNLIVIGNGTQYPTPVEIMPNQTNGVMYGQVTFLDGNSPWFYDELFGLNQTAAISVLNITGTTLLAGPVHANFSGWFAVAGLPGDVNVTAFAQTEDCTTNLEVSAGDVSFGGSASPVYLQLPNYEPEILTVVPQVDGSFVQTAPGGATIELNAYTKQLNDNTLAYTWKVLPGEGSLTPTNNGTSALWTLPQSAGEYAAYLEVADGQGGFATRRVDFSVNLTNTFFSGIVLDNNTGNPIDGATVMINCTNITTTTSNGFFLVSAPLTNRYVFNITMNGYAPFSRIFYNGGDAGHTWQLVPAQSQVVDPTEPIVLVASNGMTMRVPAGALVGPSSNRPPGLLTAYFANYDMAAGQAPGDWGALTNGQEANLISYGSGFFEFVDSGFTNYNLTPGTTAEVDITPPALMLSNAPPYLPMWYYNNTNGYWMPSGSALLNATNHIYIGEITTLPVFNAGKIFSQGACLSVLLYPPLPAGGELLQVSDPTGMNFQQTFNYTLESVLSGIYRLPPNINVRLQLFAPDGNQYSDIEVVNAPGLPGTPIQDDNINTGPPAPVGAPISTPPYTSCNLVALFSDALGAQSSSVFLTLKGQGTEAQATAYYAAVDPMKLRTTLADWWNVNGFMVGATGWPTDASTPGGDPAVVRTSYLNNNDLGSGRDMYFRNLGNGNLAAFVVNYGLFDQNPINADFATNRAAPFEGAVVCMEYSPVEGQGNTPIVKFFVYNFPLTQYQPYTATLQIGADLDGFGVKYVPNLCINCHGGDYTSPSSPPTFGDINMGANFRELDTATYKFPRGRLVPNATEQAAFLAQNLLIANAGSGCTSLGIQNLIAGWYATSPPAEDNTWTPSGWSGSANSTSLYQQVIKESCRTCHVAIGNDTSPAGINWTSYAQLTAWRADLVGYVLCQQRIMPHSVITYRNFWTSPPPNEPDVLQNYSDGSVWSPLPSCP
jgi:hypothetical protein